MNKPRSSCCNVKLVWAGSVKKKTVIYRCGKCRKICNITGDKDWQFASNSGDGK